jgi:integrase
MDSTEMRFLSPGEVQSLADAVPPRYRALILTAAYTGLRWGELVGLRAKRLDLAARRVTVTEALSEVRGDLTFKTPKTAASRRTVALPAPLVDVLADHLSEYPAVGNGLVFTQPEGGPIRRTNFRQRVWLALDTYGHLMPGMDEADADRLGVSMKHSGSTGSSASVSEIRPGI